MYHLSKYVNQEQLTRALIDLVSHNMPMFEDLDAAVKSGDPVFEDAGDYDVWKEFYSLVYMLTAHADRVHDQQTRLSNALVNALASIRAQYPEADIDATMVPSTPDGWWSINVLINQQPAGRFRIVTDSDDTEQAVTKYIHDEMALIVRQYQTGYGLDKPQVVDCIRINEGVWHISDEGHPLCKAPIDDEDVFAYDVRSPDCMECLTIRREQTGQQPS